MIYIFSDMVAVLLAYVAGIFRKQNNKNSKIYNRNFLFRFFYFLSFMILFLLAAIRYYVGTDYTSYSVKLTNDILFNTENKTEILFKLLTRFSVITLGSTQWIFVISSFLVTFFVYKAIADQTNNLGMGVFLFVFTTFFGFSLNGIRQAIATSIFLYALKFIRDKNMLKYFLWIFIAFCFHKSAALYFVVYFFNYFEVPRNRAVFATGFMTVFVYFFRDNVRQFIYLMVNKFTNYGRYFGSKFENVLTSIDNYFLLLNALIMLLIWVYISYRAEDSERNEKLKVYIWLQVLLTIFSAISFAIPNAVRIFYMLIPVQIIMIPNILNSIENRNIRLISAGVMISCYSYLFYYFTIFANFNGTLPYEINSYFLRSLF